MYIRRLCLTDEADFRQELHAIGKKLPPETLKSYLPSQFIFKFCDISESVYPRLTAFLREKRVTFWENSFPSPKALITVASSWNLLPPDLTDGELVPVLKSWKVLRENNNLDSWDFKISGSNLKIDRPMMMGILNVTPDSFSDGGQFSQPHEALRQAEMMIDEGADIIDIGAESTRPGAREVSVDEEWQRLEPVLNTLKNRVNIPVSIDTYKSEIARRALDSGADIINDISGLTFDEKMAEVAGKADCPVVIMHIKGTPRNMQVDPHYDNLLEELFLFFQERISYCERQGIHQIMIDPGIGFGKRLEDNYEIIRRLGEFKSFGYPILVGPSRKSFIGKVLNKEVRERLFGTAAAVSASLQNGGNIIRVHDVMEMSEILRITRAIKSKNFLQQID